MTKPSIEESDRARHIPINGMLGGAYSKQTRIARQGNVEHVVMITESLDRISFSAIIPKLQVERNTASIFLQGRRAPFVMEIPRMTRQFTSQIERFERPPDFVRDEGPAAEGGCRG